MCSNRFINNNFNNNFNNELPTNLRYGNSYVPVQNLRNVYAPREGLAYGSMFPELVDPYCPNQSIAETEYLKNYNERGCI